jgi:hypothetical protein
MRRRDQAGCDKEKKENYSDEKNSEEGEKRYTGLKDA